MALKMQDVKMTDQVARHENAGHVKIVTYFSIVLLLLLLLILSFIATTTPTPEKNTHETQNKDCVSQN